MKMGNGLMLAGVAVAGALVGGKLLLAAPLPEQSKLETHEWVVRNELIPFREGSSISLNVQSSGVEWKGYSYHLLQLGSIRFDFNRETGCLKAEVQAGVTEFDRVSYDVSVAVLDGEGRLLGAARAPVEVSRNWLGKVVSSGQKVELDFGVSLDYAKASSFMATVSRRKVLTPDDWQK